MFGAGGGLNENQYHNTNRLQWLPVRPIPVLFNVIWQHPTLSQHKLYLSLCRPSIMQSLFLSLVEYIGKEATESVGWGYEDGGTTAETLLMYSMTQGTAH